MTLCSVHVNFTMKLQLQIHDTFFLFGVHSTCPALLPPYWQVVCTPLAWRLPPQHFPEVTCQNDMPNPWPEQQVTRAPQFKSVLWSELHRHPVRSDSLHCSFSFTFCRLHGTAVWPAFARLINRVLFSNLSLFFFSLSLFLLLSLSLSLAIPFLLYTH